MFWGWDVLRLGRFEAWDVLWLETFCSWDVLELGRLVLGRFVLGRFVSGRFVGAPNRMLGSHCIQRGRLKTASANRPPSRQLPVNLF